MDADPQAARVIAVSDRRRIRGRRMEAMAYRITDRYVTAAGDTLTMVGLVQNNGLVRASDRVRQAADPTFWPQYRAGESFSLYLLRDVPINLAEKLVDHGKRGGFQFGSSRDAWRAAKPYAESRPLFQSR